MPAPLGVRASPREGAARPGQYYNLHLYEGGLPRRLSQRGNHSTLRKLLDFRVSQELDSNGELRFAIEALPVQLML